MISKLKKVKNITLLFMIFAILGFSSIVLYLAMNDKKEHIEQNIKIEKVKLELEFTKKVFELQKTYNEKLEELILTKEIIDAFEQRDRKKLDRVVQPYFSKLIKENPNFELICFGLPNMKAFYRAHMQNKFGDDISRVQGVSEVNSIKKRVSGFMLSKVGLYYRVTFPIFSKDKYIGLVAFGINLGFVNDHIHEKLDTETAIIVKTKELKKSKWFDMLEEGYVGSYTIIASTGELISKLDDSVNIEEQDERVSIGSKIYNLINNIDIEDINGKKIAKVILFQDVTQGTKDYKFYMYTFIGVLVLLILLISYVLAKTFNKFLSTIMSINNDLVDLNKNLEKRVEEEVHKNREKEKQLFEQSKNAQMGEMIGNIAHQWRQPLSAISTSSSALVVKKEMGILSDTDLDESLHRITESTMYLSKTIDDFRDFLSDEKNVAHFILQDQIDKVVNIVDANLKSSNISIIKDYADENIEIDSISGELSQVLLNVLNNAKDILLNNNIESKKIILSVLKEDDNAVVTIEDNAGGIPKEIMPKIFDPYFTTKHQSQGTGIGLYMSNTIVKNSLKGKIYAENTQQGAKFIIKIPLSI
ncbi:MAG: ATP-binding protein [Campylobacterota bacterium]|nr:ATP-binding protein [Campylobacterota bacterium]